VGRVFIETLTDVMAGGELCIAYGLFIDDAMTPELIADWLCLSLWGEAVYRFDAGFGKRIAARRDRRHRYSVGTDGAGRSMR
jgi:hypothetical protein